MANPLDYRRPDRRAAAPWWRGRIDLLVILGLGLLFLLAMLLSPRS